MHGHRYVSSTFFYMYIMFVMLFITAVGQNIFPKSIVCGVVPLFDDEGWKLVS